MWTDVCVMRCWVQSTQYDQVKALYYVCRANGKRQGSYNIPMCLLF